jgi:hypothetical protein
MEYQNLDLRIEGKPGETYRVRVLAEGMDEVEGSLALSPECQKIVDALQQVETLEMGSSLPMDLGLMLHQCLFHDSVRDTMLLSLGGVFRDDEKGMRIRLMLSPPELAALPWEVLCDPRTKSYLSTSGKTPLIRYITSGEPIKSLRVDSPVRVLVLIPDGSGLDVDKEEGIITAALKALDTVDINVIKGNVTRSQIKQLLNDQQYHIIHFIGHGTFKADQGYLVIDPDERDGGLISADDFADFFTDYPSLKLVVLNCCQGGQVSSKDKYAGMAAKLVASGMPAVVAMQYPISDDAALVFAREFYLKLCKGWSRGQVDMAISHARQRIYKEVKEPMAFATPVLFLRSDNSIIFDLEQASEEQGTTLRRLFSLFSSAPVKNRNRLKQVKQTREKNIEAWQEKTKYADEETRQKAAEAIVQEQVEIKALDQRLIHWNRAVLASLLATLVMFLAGFTGLFNVLHADDWLETRFIPYMDEFVTKKFSPDIRLILAEDGPNGTLGNPGSAWRKYHPSLIDKLTEAGAKVIVFDLQLDKPNAAYDIDFADAIRRAKSRGTRIILGKGLDEYGRIKSDGDLTSEFAGVAGDEWGNYDVGGSRHGGIVRIYQLAQLDRSKADANSAEVPIIPSLGLLAVSAFLSSNSNVKASYNKDRGEVQLNSDGKILRSIPVYENIYSDYDFPFNLADRKDNPERHSDNFAPPKELSAATDSYAEIFNQNDQEFLKRRYRKTIVLVGFKKPDDLFSVFQAEKRYGTEIHANVISNILTETYVGLLSTPYELLIVMVLVVLGVLVKARFSHVFAATIVVPFTEPKKTFDLPGLLVVADVVYLLVAFLLYKNRLIYILKTYHLVTPFLAYWLTGKLRKKTTLKPLKRATS